MQVGVLDELDVVTWFFKCFCSPKIDNTSQMSYHAVCKYLSDDLSIVAQSWLFFPIVGVCYASREGKMFSLRTVLIAGVYEKQN